MLSYSTAVPAVYQILPVNCNWATWHGTAERTQENK